MATKCPKCHSDNPDTQQYCGECGTQLILLEEIPVSPTKTIETPTEELTTGSIFAGRYQIIEELGKGGMGKVYKANDIDIKEKVAIKLIKPEISTDKKTIERFQNELKFARKISHRNVCRMYDLNKEEGSYYITMEYVEGQDLKSLVRQTGQLAIPTTISIAKQVCEGLSEAHKMGTVHRDLKPSNIMIDKEGNTRIMDFGIARSLESKGITGAGVMIGTPEYMSPEQVEGKEVDQRSDIYSLGVILYEMVTGRVPFEGDTPFTIGVKQKSEIPKDPKELNTQIPEDLDKVILRCLEKDKEKRYQIAEEVRSELENIEKGIPTTEKVIPKRKPITSKEITVTFGLKKLLIPALVAVAIAIIALIVWHPWSQREAVPLQSIRPSIAVLPFEDLSPQKDQEYFCDGLAEELINRLANIENLRIPGRTSAFSFKSKDLDIREIGEKLNVEMVLDGSVRKERNKLRITAQLVKVADGYPIWSKIYERSMEDTFALWDEISLAIVDNLKIKLLGEEKTKLVKRYTENLEAYNLYIKGRYFWNKRTEEGLKKAIEHFEQAVKLDPDYALAYAGKADAHNMLAAYVFLSPHEAFSEAKVASLKALEIDDALAEAYTSSAFAKHRYDWDWSGAENDFKKAIRLNPNYATAHNWYGSLLYSIGRFDEAHLEKKRALELDPLSVTINTSIAWSYKLLGKYNQAIEQCKKTIELSSDYAWPHAVLAQTYIQMSRFEEAIIEFQKATSLAGRSLEYLPQLGHAYAMAGNREQALKIIEEVNRRSEEGNVSWLFTALNYAGLGDTDKAFECLEMAYKSRDTNMYIINIEPRIDSLRSDPRFTSLLKKMGLEK